ncbi:MAG: hypothetical protein FJX23_01855 [Alphaproteobacteria bacterium]|nr:hypothetical protein [Alphaproteobacteria bacterium]
MSEAFRAEYEAANPELARRLKFNIPAADVGLFNFSHCKMGDEGMRYVHGILEHPERIENLILGANLLTDKSAPLLADIIRRAPKMKELSITRNSFTDKGLAVLAEAIGEHPKLEEFRSAENAAKGEALAALFCKFNADEAEQGKSTKGSAFILSSMNEMPSAVLVKLFNAQGITLGAKELLRADGKPAPLLKRLCENPDGVEPLFTLENWQGNQGEMKRVYQALPEAHKPTNFHALLQQLRGTRDAGIGR